MKSSEDDNQITPPDKGIDLLRLLEQIHDPQNAELRQKLIDALKENPQEESEQEADISEMTVREKADLIIRRSARLAAGSSAMLAPVALLALDVPLIVGMHAMMVCKIGQLFDFNIGSQESAKLVTKWMTSGIGAMGGRAMLGSIPIIGGVVNATITYKQTESIGWCAFDYFEKAKNHF